MKAKASAMKRYLDSFIEGAEKYIPEEDELETFAEDLKGFLDGLGNPPLFEYSMHIINGRAGSWALTKRSPLVTKRFGLLENNPYFLSRTRGTDNGEHYKYLRHPFEFAYLDGKGFYVALGGLENGIFMPQHKAIYLIRQPMQKFK